MAAAEVNNGKHRGKIRTFLQGTPKTGLVWMLLNTIAPIVVLVFIFRGGQVVLDSQRVAREAIEEKDQAVAELRAAVFAKEQAIRGKDTAERDTQELLEEQNRIREENAKLNQNPTEVIAQVRRELGGRTRAVRADSLYKRGRDAFAEGNLKLARELYSASLEEDDRNVWALIGLGNVASSEKSYHVAEKQFMRAVGEAPENKIANFDLASVSAALKKWDQAQKYLTKTLELDPSYEPAKKLRDQISQHP